MPDYKHGAYGQIAAAGSRMTDDSQSVIVYVGTAPVQSIDDYSGSVNKPIVVHNMAEARKYFGYSDDWAKYTLCEAMHVHFEMKGVGALVLINVLDPATHRASEKTTMSATPSNGVVIVSEAEDAILSTVTVKSGNTAKVKGTDYSLTYDGRKKQIIIRELTTGALGSTALTIEYYAVTPEAVTSTTVIGTTDGYGTNTGLYAIKDVYQLTGCVPAYIGAPGWSSIPAVHTAMYQISQKVNGHWDAYMFVDLPLMNNSTPVTLATAATFKEGNGYNNPNETVYFPMAAGTDGKNYHLSVLAAANFLELLLEYDGIPFHTSSNTECSIIKNLHLGGANTVVADDEVINNALNKNGIASAAFVGGRWAIWGAHSADYNPNNGDTVNVAETNRMMLYYVSNDFQHRRMVDVDRPMTANDLKTIAAEEQARLDALMKIGALTYGEVSLNAELMDRADIMSGDFSFTFNVTTTPLAKSLTAVVNWTEDGFVTYYESFITE